MRNRDFLMITPPYHCGVVEVAGRWLPLNLLYVGEAARRAGMNPALYDAMSLFVDWDVIDSLGNLAHMAERYGVTLCVKAHVGASIYNTPTTLKAMAEISSPAFGIDMDPSHIHRAGENPVEAIAAVISRVR